MHKRYLFPSAIVLLFLIIISYMLCSRSSDSEVNWAFKGPLQKVTYGDDNVIDTIVVNRKIYILSDIEWAAFNINVANGDTVFKEKGDRYIKFIKAGAKDTIYYNKEF